MFEKFVLSAFLAILALSLGANHDKRFFGLHLNCADINETIKSTDVTSNGTDATLYLYKSTRLNILSCVQCKLDANNNTLNLDCNSGIGVPLLKSTMSNLQIVDYKANSYLITYKCNDVFGLLKYDYVDAFTFSKDVPEDVTQEIDAQMKKVLPDGILANIKLTTLCLNNKRSKTHKRNKQKKHHPH